MAQLTPWLPGQPLRSRLRSPPRPASARTRQLICHQHTTALPVTYTCLQSSIPSEASAGSVPAVEIPSAVLLLTLNIVTTAPTSQLRPPLGHGSRIFYALLLPGLFGIVFAVGSRTRSARLLGLIVVLGVSTLGLGSCGGGGGSRRPKQSGNAGGKLFRGRERYHGRPERARRHIHGEPHRPVSRLKREALRTCGAPFLCVPSMLDSLEVKVLYPV